MLNIRLLNATNLTTYADWVFLGNNMRIYFKEQNSLLSVREFRYSSSRSNRISKFLYPSCRWDCAEREGTCPQRFDLLRGSTSLKETFAPNGYWPTGTIVFFTVVLSVFFSFAIQHSVSFISYFSLRSVPHTDTHACQRSCAVLVFQSYISTTEQILGILHCLYGNT